MSIHINFLFSIVGHLVSLPLMFPFESWRFQVMETRIRTLQKTQGIVHSIVTGDLWFLSSSGETTVITFINSSVPTLLGDKLTQFSPMATCQLRIEISLSTWS